MTRFGASHHIFACHLCIFFGEMSVQVFPNFLIWWLIFTLFSFKCFLHILNNRVFFLDLSFANIFFKSVAALLIFLTVSFTEWKFFISFTPFVDHGFVVVSKKSPLHPRILGLLRCYLLGLF